LGFFNRMGPNLRVGSELQEPEGWPTHPLFGPEVGSDLWSTPGGEPEQAAGKGT